MKRIFTLVTLLLCSVIPALAQDDCNTATALTVGTSCNPTTFDIDGSIYSVSSTAQSLCTASTDVDDAWCSFVAVGSSTTIEYTNTTRNALIILYSGTCPGAMTQLACTNNVTQGTEQIVYATTAGTTYYIRVDRIAGGNNAYMSGTICVYGSAPPPSNDDPCSATSLTVGSSCSYSTYTTAGATSTTAGSPPAPGCANYLGGDVWFTATVPASGSLDFDTQTGIVQDGGMAVYSGTCGALTLLACDDDNSSNGLMPYISLSCLTPGSTVYIRFWEYGNDVSGSFGICVTDPSASSAAPANDAACNAISLSLGVTTTGTVTGATGCNEAASPGCWTNGTMNTVWYSVVCPASGQLSIRTGLGTLTNTQIQAFSGTCGSLTSIGCNNDVTLCGNTQQWSELVLTGLTPGSTYYVRVDGYSSLTGDFTITAIDGTSTWPIVYGQDCSVSLPVCAVSSTVGNPGFIGSGNYCDYPGNSTGCPGGSCIYVGERNSVWYTLTTNAAGTLSFTLTPNSPVDFDFALYDITGNASACSQIAANTILPIRCSYSGLIGSGATGMGSTGTEACDGTGGTLDQWTSTLAVTAGQTFLLLVSNYSTSSFVGFNINWNTSPINYSGSTTLTWTGAVSTDWNNTANWGGCSIPDCTKDVLIFSGPTNQPVIPTGTTVNCKSITIQGGSSVTLNGTAQLNVCGDFINNGTFTAAATSTVAFTGTGTQNVNGNNSGTNAFGNFTVTKTAGSVVLNQNTDMKGTLTISNGTSVLNINGKYVKIGGNFTNVNGSTTITGAAGSTVEFNGSSAQTYNQGSSTLTLNNVIMNHTGTGVTANTNMVLGTSGVLTLTQGKIITNANEVQVTNTASGACSAGNTTSFVQGNLRRYITGSTAYDFPVGHATKGYQRANITFTTATTIPQLLAYFTSWPSVPTGPAANECPNNTYNVLPALDNGYWTITASANATSGNYNVTLYSTNYTNSAGAAGWTVMKANTGAGPWSLNGTCAASTASTTIRTGLNGFSAFAVAQSATPLPIELLSFTGTAEADFNHLEWSTATETNNDYFTLERSTDGITFNEVGRVVGSGTTSQLHNYSFNDMEPGEGVNYYRLKQTDFNGLSTYSQLVTLEFHRGHMVVSNVRPNPTSGTVDFDFASPEETEIHFIITDITGRIVKDERRMVKAGVTTINTLIPDEGAGVYSLKVIEESHGFISVSRIVKY